MLCVGYIDLSKRQVEPADVTKCLDRFNKAKAVHSVLKYIAGEQKMTLEGMYQLIGWPLYKKYGHAYDAFKLAIRLYSQIMHLKKRFKLIRVGHSYLATSEKMFSRESM